MFRLEASALLPAPPDHVFAAVAAVESAVHWQEGVVGVRRAPAADDGPAVGGPAPARDVVLLRYAALGGRHALLARVTEAAPPGRVAYEAAGLAFTLTTCLTLEPVLGGTAVSYQLALTTHAPLPGADAPEPDAAALRRLLVHRAPRDLVGLEQYVARLRRERADAGAAVVVLPPLGVVTVEPGLPTLSPLVPGAR